MKTLYDVKNELLTKAKSTIPPKFGFKRTDGAWACVSQMPSKYAEQAKGVVIATVENKYINGNKIQDEAPITVVSAPEGLLGNAKTIFSFVTPALGDKSLTVEVVEKGFFSSKVQFPENHNFAVAFEEIKATLYRSSINGKLYEESELPEQNDDNVTEWYAKEVKAERNARIADTDSYAQLPDVTVKTSEYFPRRQLTDEEKVEVTAYRQALRDWPMTEGFPWVEFPAIPTAIYLECEEKIVNRESMKDMGDM